MKKFTKLLSALLMFAMLAVCMASCASNNSGSMTEGFVNDTYKLGCTGPLTGEASSYGISVQHGAVVAIEEINANGGLNGKLFSFEMKDDEADSAKAGTGYNALMDNGMQVSIGAVTSGACKAFAESAAKDKVFALTPSASEEAVIEKGNNIFRICFGDDQQGALACDKLFETYKKVGAIYDSSDSYSTGLYNAFKAEAEKNGKVLNTDFLEYSFDTESKLDFSSQITALKNANCDVIFLPIYYQQAALIAKEAAKQSFNVPVFGCDGLDGIAEQLKGSNVTASVTYITPFDADSTDEKVKKFVEAYKAKYNDTPDQFAADAYDAVMVVFEAMKSAGVNDINVKAEDLCSTLVAAISAEGFTYSGVTGSMKWPAANGGSCEKSAQIKKVN